MLIIRQGSTPTITMGIPDHDDDDKTIDMEHIGNAWVYIWKIKGRPIITKKMSKSEVIKDNENRELKVTLTQEDTLSLPLGICYIQIKLFFNDTNGALPSSEAPVRVLVDGNAEVISNDN